MPVSTTGPLGCQPPTTMPTSVSNPQNPMQRQDRMCSPRMGAEEANTMHANSQMEAEVEVEVVTMQDQVEVVTMQDQVEVGTMQHRSQG